jgi:hypothetical protein
MANRPERTRSPKRRRAGGARVNDITRRGMIAAFLAAALAAGAPGPSAAAKTNGPEAAKGFMGSSPLAHAPGFRQAFGERAQAGLLGAC